MSSEIAVIVERLNDVPFQMGLSLASFDEKSPFELLEIVNMVMGFLSEQHKVDLRDETPERTINRMMEFLRQLNFKPGVDPVVYQQALLQGDPNAIYPTLHWMLVRLPDLKKRAYLARFLVPFDLPEHLFADEEVAELFAHHRELQEGFKESHRQLDKLQQQSISPGEIKRYIVQMEEDKEQLVTKIDSLKNRLQHIDSYQEMRDAVSALRQEQDEQMRLQGRLQEQRVQLSRAEHQVAHMQQVVRESQAQNLEGGGEELLHQLQEEVAKHRYLCDEELPRMVSDQRRRLDQLEGAMQEGPVSEEALREARAHVAGLQTKVRQLEDQKGRAAGQDESADDGLGMFRQQAALIARKREQVLGRLKASTQERENLERELMAKMAELENLAPQQRSSVPSTKSEDFKKYAANLRGKTAQYKKLKAALGELRAEFGVLHRTEQLLTAQARAVGAKLQEVEAAKGIQGYAETQMGLQKVSETKAAADEAKGQTLEEISQVVDEINEQIKARKNRLAPQIKELRALRAKYQELEAEYLEKKAVYENTAVGLDSERSKLYEEVVGYEDDIAKEESRFHYLAALTAIVDVAAARAKKEAAGATRVAEGYQQRLKAQEDQTKELRGKQRAVKESHDKNVGQLQVYKDLHKLLKCKAECQKREKEARESSAILGSQDVFTMPETGNQYTDIDGIVHG